MSRFLFNGLGEGDTFVNLACRLHLASKIVESNVKKSIEEFKKEIQKEELTPFGWNVIKSDKLLKIKLPSSEFLIEKLIPKGGITILAGQPSSGKSWILLEIAKSIASNRLLFNKFNTQEARVLVVDEEVPPQETKRRWQMLEPAILTLVDFMNLEGFRIDDPEKKKALLELCEHRGYTLVIFDSLRDIHLLNENDSREIQYLLECFRELTRRGITVLLSHHHRKENFMVSNLPNQLLRGSTNLLAGIDSLLSVENQKKTENLIELKMSQEKLRQGKPNLPFKINLIEVGGKIKLEFSKDIEDEDSKLERCKQAILALLTEGEKYQAELIEMLIPLYYSERTINRAIKELKENEEIKLRQGERKRIYLSI